MTHLTGIRFAASLLAALGLLLGALPCMAQPDPYTSLGLSWTATGDDGDVGRATRYDLRYSPSPPGPDTLTWWNATSTLRASGLPTPATSGQTDSTRVSGLSSGTQYYFIIRAIDDVGNISGFSNVATGATLVCNAPGTPQQFAAVADTGEVNLSWATTSDPLAVSLRIYRGVGTGALSLLTTITNFSQTTYRDGSVIAGTTYRYRAAWAATCGDGPSTATLSVTLPGTPPTAGGSTEQPALHAYPNPSTGPIQFVVRVPGSSAQAVNLKLYDMSGRWIAQIASGSYPPGESRIDWARRSRSGEAVAVGYYEVLGTVGGSRVRERIVLLP